MSDLVLGGNTSGTVTLSVPAVAGTTVVTLPSVSGSMLTSASDLTTQVKTATNANGTAPIYSCRAWVNFNGAGTVAITASGNVSSITDNGVGDYTVNFTTAISDINYSFTGAASVNGGNNANTWYCKEKSGMDTRTTSSVRVNVGYVSANAAGLDDYNSINVTIFR